jgi:hypothetical protein
VIEHLLSEKLLRGRLAGQESITVGVEEKDGERKLAFDTSGGASTPELVASGNEGKG